uniref:Uncharacterized protein n=1 Tax=Arundo donax TaxID=35708 RepID=A0A0A9C3V6_ARUDO
MYELTSTSRTRRCRHTIDHQHRQVMYLCTFVGTQRVVHISWL